jgi:hypothetical protein
MRVKVVPGPEPFIFTCIDGYEAHSIAEAVEHATMHRVQQAEGHEVFYVTDVGQVVIPCGHIDQASLTHIERSAQYAYQVKFLTCVPGDPCGTCLVCGVAIMFGPVKR